MDKVAVVILNWNGAEMLRKFLPSVIDNSYYSWVGIYVADNGSSDNSLEILSKEFPGVNVIKLEHNYGFAEGYNRAISLIDCEYAVLLNSDVEVTAGWIEPIIEYMDNNVDVAACQPKIMAYNDKSHFEYAGASGGYIDKYGYPFCRGRIFDFVEEDNGQYDSISRIFWASGAAMFIRKEAYIGVGGLDAAFFAHMEEIDLCWRLNSRGYRLMCIPQSKVYHVGGATLKKENPRKTYLNFRNNLLMLYKNLPDSELSDIMFVRALLDCLAIMVFILKLDFPNAKAVLSARSDYSKMKKNFQFARKENIIKSSEANIYGRFRFSIIWKNKISRVKCFSRL